MILEDGTVIKSGALTITQALLDRNRKRWEKLNFSDIMADLSVSDEELIPRLCCGISYRITPNHACGPLALRAQLVRFRYPFDRAKVGIVAAYTLNLVPIEGEVIDAVYYSPSPWNVLKDDISLPRPGTCAEFDNGIIQVRLEIFHHRHPPDKDPPKPYVPAACRKIVAARTWELSKLG